LSNPKIIELSRRNATFQEIASLRENRNRRFREGRFLVEGVKPLEQLVRNGWEIEALLAPAEGGSRWAQDFVKRAGAPLVYRLSAELMQELSGKEESAEVVAVAKAGSLDPAKLPQPSPGVVLVVDNPNSPGNLGSLVRSAEAFGARAVLTYGHAADFFDPKTIAASIGTVFAMPLGHLETPTAFGRWLDGLSASGIEVRVAALDEKGTVDSWKLDRGGLTVLVVGNETRGLSKVFLDGKTLKVRIPMRGSATSLNAANSGSILLYELLARGDR
jgi:TrmH family RNA methyltransferase